MSWIKRHPLIAFFVLAFVLSWSLSVPGLFLEGWPGFVPALAGFGPAAAALIVAGSVEGPPGAKKLLAALFRWRVPVQWYLVVLLGPLLTMAAAALLYRLVHGEPGVVAALSPAQMSGVGVMLLIVFAYVMLGIWGEEVGWRGYALPELQRRFHPLVATLILGVMWGLWHLPYFGIPGGVHQQMGLPYFMVAAVGYTILYTWVYNGSGGSLLLMCMLHAANNTTVSTTMTIFPALIADPVFSLAVLALFDVLVIVLAGPRLGNTPERGEAPLLITQQP